jgi:hypothetical protein
MIPDPRVTESQPSFRFLFVASLVLLVLGGCTSIRPNPEFVDPDFHEPTVFSYEDYAHVLDTYVDEHGLVNYSKLVQNPGNLDRFYNQIAAVSPDSHPTLFPTENDRMAYWINAYNSTVIKGVVEYYPINSVEDVEEPALLFFFPSKSGFFLFQRFTYGSIETNLYQLENSVIRDRFDDPRIHFALNCASSSCPRLPRQPFYPESLEYQLQEETKKFINSPENVRYDSNGNVLYLSSIFDWYEDDFINWIKGHYPEQKPTLANFVMKYLLPETFQSIGQSAENLKIVFLPYDWGINDQNRKQ